MRRLDKRANHESGDAQPLFDPQRGRAGTPATGNRIHKEKYLFHASDPTGMMVRMKFDNWRQQFDFIDTVMKSVSGITDPQDMVNLYGDAIDQLFPVDDWMAVSRRGLESPCYRITRSSRYEKDFNPWKQRDQLPILRGGLLGEIAYSNKPAVIEDLRVERSDPAYEFLRHMRVLVALPQYDNHEGLNLSISMWDDPKKLDLELLPMIHWQSNLFGRATLNMVLKNQLAQAYAELDRELEVVARMQRALLPRQLPSIPGISLAAHYETARRAGGDFYDLFPMSDGSCGLLIGDVSGHGTPAAVMMAITHTLVHSHPGEPAPPAQVMSRLNRTLCRRYTRDSGAFVTAFYGILSRDRRAFRYSAAGHNPPRRVSRSSTQSEQLAEAAALPLGIDADADYTESTVNLSPADALVLYTDGIVEAMNTRGELFGYPRLDEALTLPPLPPGEGRGEGAPTNQTTTPADHLVTALVSAVDAFREGRPFSDDRTVLAAVIEA